MKNRLYTLFIALVATTALWAQNNVITYTATEKLTETTDTYSNGLHTNAFNVAITSHTFSNGTGTITFAGDVTTIGDNAFFNCDILTTVTFPNSVTTIVDYAFSGCTGLTSVTIPNSVTTIGNYAFKYCSDLTSVTIPNSVTTIGEEAFCWCYKLTSITFGKSVTTIGSLVLYYCNGLTSIICEASAPPTCAYGCFTNVDKSIPLYVPKSSISAYQKAYAWKDFTNIQPIGGEEPQNNVITYTATEKLTETTDKTSHGLHTNAFNVSITSHTFDNGTGTITFAGDVTKIGEYAFYGCDYLTSITIPNSVTTIGYDAFSFCRGLTSVTMGNSVKTIDMWAFEYCTSLTSITIPSSVTSIHSDAFWVCSGLASIIVDSDNRKYDSRDNCNAIIETSTNTLIQGCKNTIIPNSVKTIGGQAFYHCDSLTSITIPSSVTYIGYHAFQSCSGLASIVVDNGNKTFDSRDNCNAIIETSTNTLIKGCKNTIIPNSVKTIGDDAFGGCSGLTSITIPNSVTTIGDEAFSGCDSLTSVTIGNSVRTMGYFVFEYCYNLVSITCLATTPPTCISGFYDMDKSILLYVPRSSISAYQIAYGWKDFTNIKAIEDCTDFDINNTTITVSELEALVMVPLDARGEITKYSYWLYLDNAHTDLVCSMDFNATGKMSNPVIRKAPMREQTDELQTFDSFTFEISGLEANTTYYYVLKASTNAKTFIKEDSFTTKASAVRDVSSQIKKVCKQNQILLEVNGNTYDIWGNKH